MDELQEQFDDPALRSAVQRAHGKPAAPAHLRQKIAAMMATTVAAPAPRRARSRWRLPEMPQVTWRVAAVAALVFVAVGLAGVQIYFYVDEFLPHRYAAPQPVKFQASFAALIVAAHDNCAHLPDHHLVAGEDFEALRTKLSKEEGLPVFASALSGGWEFKGAGICKVGDAKAAHLLFARGVETASVFTLLAENTDCGMNDFYAQSLDGHALTGVARASALYVIVVSNSAGKEAPVDDARVLLNSVQCAIPGSYSDATQPPGSGT